MDASVFWGVGGDDGRADGVLILGVQTEGKVKKEYKNDRLG